MMESTMAIFASCSVLMDAKGGLADVGLSCDGDAASLCWLAIIDDLLFFWEEGCLDDLHLRCIN